MPETRRDRDPLLVSSLTALLLVLWLGFLVHRSPRFAGSALGGVLGVTGGLFMVWPLAYTLVKRVPGMKRVVTRCFPLRSILSGHIYTGIVGSLLGLLHTGHKFGSALGVALTTAMFLVVISGYLGRYFQGFVSRELHEKKALHSELVLAFQGVSAALVAARHPALAPVSDAPAAWRRWRTPFSLGGLPREQADEARRAFRLAESIADLEYSIRAHARLLRQFTIWLALHIIASAVFYVLLGLHVWSGVYFGLRWFQ